VRRCWRALAAAALRGPIAQRPAACRQAWSAFTAHQAQLQLWLGDQCQQELVLEDRRYRIGRDPACELPLAYQGLSRVHAVLEKERSDDREFVLEDFASANGLFHRDRRIRSIQLRDGDAVRLGSPLKGEAPELRYCHPRSGLEQLLHLLGLVALGGSTLLVSGMLAAATVGGGSKIRTIAGPVKIHASDGTQIDAKQGSATALPSLHSYPRHLRLALLASEEARFGWNSGIDLFGTLRSAVKRSGGGSGLTQQVARLYYADVGRDESLTRKLRELWVALQLEVGYSKNRILKMYLDRAHLGQGSDGFEQAARLYFRKSASDLDLAESAFLVGLLPAPNYYSPCGAPQPGEEAAILQKELLEIRKGKLTPEDQARIEAVRRGEWLPVKRRNLVLKLMHEQGHLGPGPQGDQALRDAQRRPLNIDVARACSDSAQQTYPYFSDYVLGELRGRRFGLHLDEADGGNYYVESTIDLRLQALAQTELRRFLDGPAAAAGLKQGALISLQPSSGAILAYVGGGDYERSSFDRVQALRQPGSTFKLFPFLAALEAGVQPGDAVSCAPLANVAGCSHGAGSGGSASVIDGFAFSENVVALRLGDKAGLEQVLKRARQLGISTPLNPDYNTMLGGSETYLYEIARAYAVVANGGRSVPLHGVKRIVDLGICPSIKSLATCPQAAVTVPRGEAERQLVTPQVAAAMDQLLAAVVQDGTGRAAGRVADARGKTGTTNNGVDVLFIGYSPGLDLLTAIWMGNDDNAPAEAASGALVAELWGRYMQAASRLSAQA
jgi:peptidoglycan glycosyltransferase